MLLVAFFLAGTGLLVRLADWQILQHTHLARMQSEQQAALTTIPPMRGHIYDASGSPLATDVTLDLVYGIPKEIKDPARTAQLLAPLVGRSARALEDILTGYANYALIAPTVSQDASDKIRGLGLPGIVLAPQIRRDYPAGTFASQLLGFSNLDNQGNYGVEGYYDRILSGTAGLRSVLKDTAGNDIRISAQPDMPSHDGGDLYLSLDRTIQGLAEFELQKAVQKHHADGGTIIVMDPRTGYILAMAGSPTYDPNQYWTQDPSHYRNPAVEWTYEPGSTFKVITMAAGLDSHVITPDTAFDDTGVFTIDGVALHNWNDGPFGWETMTQVLQHSANVGASFVSQRLGADRFYHYVRAFGIGEPTGVDLSDEQSGLLPLPGEKTWTPVNQYTNSFGQGLATTPLQMIRAISAVANGGLLMKPQVVKRIVYQGRIIDRPPVVQRRVISPETAHTLTTMLVKSAIGGEAALGLVKGYNIAAKTGTANIAGPDGKYIQGATIASITGYAPAFHPRFAALVIIDHPRDTPWGSMAAAPILRDLFQDLFMYDHIPPAAHPIGG